MPKEFKVALGVVAALLVTLAVIVGASVCVWGVDAFGVWLRTWQTLVAASVASIVGSTAAYIAFRNTTRSLKQAERFETNRRSRRHVALRATLPMALSQISTYAEHSAHALIDLTGRFTGEGAPHSTVPKTFAQPLPDDTLKAFVDFIESADHPLDVTVLEMTLSWIQIHDARIRSLVKDNRNPASSRTITRWEIEGYVIDAAIIYAGAASAFEYARRRVDRLPITLSWDEVLSALVNMSIWEDEHPGIYEALKRKQAVQRAPFEQLSADLLNEKKSAI